MSDHLDLLVLDADGAVAETQEAAVEGLSRSTLLRNAGIGGGTLLASGGLMSLLSSGAMAASSSGDIAILNYALTLEYLESAFYAEAVAKGNLHGATKNFAKVVAGHEATHVTFLKKALGSKAVAKPKFDFQGTNHAQKSFQKVSAILETTGVSAYAGQGPLIKNKAYTAAALSIHSVEARHAAWINAIMGVSPAPKAFDVALTKAQVLKAVGATGFIVG